MKIKTATEEQNHLPVIGVGPLYVLPTVAVTILAIALTKWGIIPPLGTVPVVPFYSAGSLSIVCGIYLWAAAVFSSRIDVKIKQNTLVTDGIYAHVRNPIYSAFLFLCTGALLLCCNIFLLILPPLFWLYLTVFIKLTEEKWLLKQYGAEFETYCKKVNRCIPSIVGNE
ncbi:methyltransferase family protein [Treponema pedis]|uniref:methyltransferase family protein n=1 Tax=Treponema pedis TaxID=409322 RepID=UPI00197F4E84|nr:isoprenylcysteine carboxylmethyltransferase family protein [Treponema pedis]QSI04175.1 isoprenylcysteine carboxylmethyltransferase family protein [Treponema pedis]